MYFYNVIHVFIFKYASCKKESHNAIETKKKNEMIYGLRREKLGSAYEVQLMTKQTAFYSIFTEFN
jgi:hypothetical protein